MSEIQFPKMGLGTWQLKPVECTKAVLTAIDLGYRMIDTAQMYKNEQAVGEALAQNTINRKDLIVATKIWVSNLSPKRLKNSFRKSLQKLQTDYVDLLYVHWPAILYNPKKTMLALNELVDEGKVKHLGVSNFTCELIDDAQSNSKHKIVANQVEHHPYLRQIKMRDYLKVNNMTLIAYSPLARGKILDSTKLTRIAEKHHVSQVQVCLAWIMQHGAIPIPKATSEAHLRDNFAAQDLLLDEDDISQIDRIKVQHRLFKPPFLAPKFAD